jgi:hypothetical protein
MDGSKLIQDCPVPVCIIAALVIMIGVFAIITTAPAAHDEIRVTFGETPG